MKTTMISAIFVLLAPSMAFGFGWQEPHKKIRLQDVQVLTLKEGAMTTGRRSSPVPQLSCVGGSGRGRGEPGVVQCYNRGWDGREVQWECKADLEGSVRFGSVEVVCEGYDYAEDDYILAGSCGLEYTLELTKEGRQEQKRGGSSNGWNNYNSYSSNSNYGYDENKWSGLGDLILLGVVGLVIYAFYKTCIDSNSLGDRQYSSTSDDYPGTGGPGAGGWHNPNSGYGGASAPGYGGSDYDAGCGGGARRRGTGAGGYGGFWTGAATGGLLGYMFGNRNTGYGGYNRGYRTGYTGGSGWGSSGRSWGGGGGGGGMASASSGTRTASGFGGTRRR